MMEQCLCTVCQINQASVVHRLTENKFCPECLTLYLETSITVNKEDKLILNSLTSSGIEMHAIGEVL